MEGQANGNNYGSKKCKETVRMGMGRPGPGLGSGPCGPKANLRGHGSTHKKIVSDLADPMGILGRSKFKLYFVWRTNNTLKLGTV